jgi:16S rRNA (guanine527-N7)-methyltransferase
MRAAACGLDLDGNAVQAIARHMQRVLDADRRLHLTAIDDPAEFLERHVGESLEGATLIEPAYSGALLDVGSGNGYPGLAVAAVRRGLRPILAEASQRKAEFLRRLLEPDFPEGLVLEQQVQRAEDLAQLDALAVVVCRGMGNWERVLPRLAVRLRADGRLLVWAGDRVEQVRTRGIWRRLRLVERRALPGRERSWVWAFTHASAPT